MSTNKPLTVFFSVGEPSGDLHGANLIRQLQRRVDNFQAVGYGGPEMEKAGCRLHEDLTALAVMWLLHALLNIHKFWALYRRADRFFRQQRPDAVVLVDYPGFNWWIARAAKRNGIPVFYFSPPQIWAWASWRVRKMRRFVDHVLCGLPFEQDWFNQRGCNATFIGHPYFDEVRRLAPDPEFMKSMTEPEGPLVVILPGSRTQEVTWNLEAFLKAAAKVRREVPDVRFAVAAFKPSQARMAEAMVAAADVDARVFTGRTPELIQAADCCMAVSGSVSLELLYHAKPTVIQYQVGRLPYFIQSIFRRVKYITLVNLLVTDELFPADNTLYDPSQPDADKVLFPEYLTWEDKSSQVAAHVVEWLTYDGKRQALVQRLIELRDEVGHGGATSKAAEYIVETLAAKSQAGPIAA